MWNKSTCGSRFHCSQQCDSAVFCLLCYPISYQPLLSLCHPSCGLLETLYLTSLSVCIHTCAWERHSVAGCLLTSGWNCHKISFVCFAHEPGQCISLGLCRVNIVILWSTKIIPGDSLPEKGTCHQMLNNKVVCSASVVRNNLLFPIRCLQSLSQFRSHLKSRLFTYR